MLPAAFDRWLPGTSAAAAAGQPVPLIYCSSNDACPPDVDRSLAGAAADARVGFISQMTPLDVPMYGLAKANVDVPIHGLAKANVGKQPDVAPLCLPLPPPAVGNDTFDGWYLGPAVAAAPCQNIQRQNLRAQLPMYIGKRRLLYAGAISGSLSSREWPCRPSSASAPATTSSPWRT